MVHPAMLQNLTPESTFRNYSLWLSEDYWGCHIASSAICQARASLLYNLPSYAGCGYTLIQVSASWPDYPEMPSIWAKDVNFRVLNTICWTLHSSRAYIQSILQTPGWHSASRANLRAPTVGLTSRWRTPSHDGAVTSGNSQKPQNCSWWDSVNYYGWFSTRAQGCNARDHRNHIWQCLGKGSDQKLKGNIAQKFIQESIFHHHIWKTYVGLVLRTFLCMCDDWRTGLSFVLISPSRYTKVYYCQVWG